MTAYAPPDIAYFSGLQFNPNIYENTLVQSVSKLYGALVTIVGTISTIITTPLFEVIQGSTTTLNMIEASTDFINTSYFKIKAPEVKITNGATNTLYLTESGGSFINNPVGTLTVSTPGYTQTGTLAQLQALTTTIAGDTANVSSNVTNLNGTLTNLSSPTTTISGTVTSLSATTTNVSGTTINLSAPTTNISGTLTTLSATTSTVSGTTTNLNATTTTVAGTTTNLNATTTNISGTTTNLNATTTSSTSTTVNATSATVVKLGSSSSLVTVGDILKMTNGFYFGTGNLTTTSGYFIQTGRSGSRASLAANSGVELAVVFPTAFSTGTPFVIAIANVLASPTSCRVATCVSVTTNLGFNANMYNPTGSGSGAYEVTYIAIGRV